MFIERLLKAFLLSFRFAVLLGILVAVFVPAIPAQAASITVDSLLNTTNNADGVCTIREAIINANNDAATWTNCAAGAGADVISFSVAGTITLTSALPNITDVDGLTIDGGSAITISGNNLFRIVTVNAGAPATFQNITLTAGSVNGSGGAISNAGNLTATNVTFTNNLTITNAANDGGAINNTATGTLTVTNSTFTGNYTLDNGGAIYIAGGTVNITGSTFTNNNNVAIDDGGAIYLNAGTLTVSSSTFTGNRANEEGGAIFKNGGTLTINNNNVFNGNISVNDGGGVYLTNAGITNISDTTFQNHTSALINNGAGVAILNGTVTITNTTFTGNTASIDGGGLYVGGGTVTVTGSTFTTNTADDGGAIFHNAATLLTITNSTFTGNLANGEADGDGGAITMNSSAAGSSLTMSGSTFSNNIANDDGGALWLNAEPVTITSTTFSGNQARSGGGAAEGGAIYNSANADSTSIRLSTFTNNTVAATANVNAYGGAIANYGAAFVLANDTFSGNAITKSTAGAGNSRGGALWSNDASTIHNVTFNGNSTAESGTGTADGGSVYRNAGVVTIANSILANATENAAAGNCGGTITNGGNNIHFNGADCPAAFTNINPDLGALTGSPAYYPLNATSPAINAGSNAICATATTTNNQSQNGVVRPVGVNCDIGSYELPDPPPTVLSITRVNPSPTSAASVDFLVTFSESVTGGDATNFTLTTTGTIAGASVTSVSAGPGATRTVTVNTGSGDGTIRLDMANSTGVADGGANPVANVPFITGEVYVIDKTAPDTSITANPANPTNSINAAFTFTGSDSGSGVASFECQLDGGGFSACTSPQNYAGLTDGLHTFDVRAIDAVGNVDASPASFSWTVDTVPPDTSITATPANPSNSSSASFSFTGTDSGSGVASFECQLDGGGFGACISPQNYAGLADGSHTFDVRAIDNAGNIDPTPASYTWLVDTTPPDTTITSNPTNPSASASATFTFTGTDGGSGVASFECQLDGGGFGACTSPQNYVGLTDGSHTFDVRAIDTVGNVDATPASYTWLVDTTPPDTTITSNPANPTSSTAATFTFTGSDSGSGVASFECQLDGGGFSACTSPQNYAGLSDGSHTFEVRAIDNIGNVDPTPATFTWTVDTLAPDTTITANPSNPSASGSASFSFTGSDSGSGVASFECQLDGGGFAACTSLQNYAGLSDGSHTFDVRAIDNAGNVDPTPASFTWLVDTAEPDTTITSNPTNPSASASASFTFTGSDGGSGVASFQCQLDGGGFSACTSPQNYAGLSDGSHTFDVRAVDSAGNIDSSPASYTWVVDTAPPDTSITANPANPTNNVNASFSFTGTDSGSGVASFECQLDGGGFSACTSPQNYLGLLDGSHTFDVRAIDNVGNIDPTPASFTWTVDTIPPDTSILTTPPNPDNDSTPSFTFNSADLTATFECQLDGGGYSPCNSGDTFGPLADGSHTFDVRAVDPAGNIDPTPASYTWTIDTTAPDTTLLTTPPNPDNNASPTFTFNSADPTATFECQLDGGGFNPCNSGDTFGPLADGTHTFDVRAVDPLGNTDPTPASYTWTLDLGAPDTNIDSAPANPTNLLAATFTFSSPDADVVGYECQLDGGGFSVCVSPQNYIGLTAGSHTFDVRAIDSANNVDPTPASFTWIIDLGFPTVTASTPANNATVTPGPNQIAITFSEDVKNDGSAGAANNTINYLLVEDGANNTFDTLTCSSGLVADDTLISINSATYTNNGGSGPFVATVNINGGAQLPPGTYRLYVCGTTSIEDLANNELNNGLSDADITFTVSQPQVAQLPATGFPQGEVTNIPAQPADKAYTSTDMWLEIPRLSVKMKIVGVPKTQDGWDVTWLNKDAGWLSGSAFPTWNGNSVITGHVWDAYNNPGPFARLKELRYGDQVKIHAYGLVYIYEVRENFTVASKDIATVFKHEEKSWLTLITCEDYQDDSKSYKYRRVVRAVLVNVTAEK
jgi:LPXTG-site transpeptidase (sortase) family protein